MAITTGGLVKLDPHVYDLQRALIESLGCNRTLRTLDAVRLAGCISVATVLRKWTTEEVTPASSGRWSSTHLQVMTYVELSWPEGYCPRCPIDVLTSV